MSYRLQVVKILLIILILAILDFVVTYLVQLLTEAYPKQLLPYEPAIITGIHVIIVAVGGYYIIKFIQGILSITVYAKIEKGMAGMIKFALDVVFYTLLVLAILVVLHVNLTGVLVGSAVGGIVIGLAVQTIAQNLLSGVLVTSSKTIKPGDSVSLLSWIWGNPIIGEVTKVSLLFTEIKSITGNIFKIPNSAFLGNTVFQKLESENSLVYPLQVIVNADVSADKVLERVKDILKDKIKDETKVEVYFTSKNGGTNVFTAVIHFQKIDELRGLIDLVNSAFDKAYWSAKS
ncbi:mechanosensitive ion channel domain-containing protein [Sulfurisphaera ohwakuensis]|uniref:mechanosensitive ion channel domain-containing protein n=1 Tax=Sulfurisphaera ohwakuensis TaxID=69656 RepID=UPI0036F2850F